MTIRVLIADDQENVRTAYRIILDAQPDMTVIAEAADGSTAVDMARKLRPDVVLADIRMPGLDGLEVTRLLAGPGVAEPMQVVVVTTFDIDQYVHTALRNGACGFILKRSGPALLTEAVRAAAAGDALISPQVTVRLLKTFRAGLPAPPRTGPPTKDPNPAPSADRNLPPLTARETEIARLVAQGRSNVEIAATLFLSPGTVKNHLANIQRKVGAPNRVGIAAWVWNHG